MNSDGHRRLRDVAGKTIKSVDVRDFGPGDQIIIDFADGDRLVLESDTYSSPGAIEAQASWIEVS